MQTDDDEQITANIEKLMQGDIKKRPYFNAIQYYYENDKDLKKAMQWALEAEKLEPKGPWFKLWKARIQLKMGDKAAAIATAQQGVKLAKESNDDEYVRLNEAVISQAKD
jgi:predicted Zn-dependent protease